MTSILTQALFQFSYQFYIDQARTQPKLQQVTSQLSLFVKLRQTKPEIGRLIVKKVANGKMIANKRRIIFFLDLESR